MVNSKILGSLFMKPADKWSHRAWAVRLQKQDCVMKALLFVFLWTKVLEIPHYRNVSFPFWESTVQAFHTVYLFGTFLKIVCGVCTGKIHLETAQLLEHV